MIQIDLTSRVPIYEQICTNIIRLASAGVLRPGDKLLPVRSLASQLGINPNTVAKAYKLLEGDGYIISNVGRGSYLSLQRLAQNGLLLLMILNRAHRGQICSA